MPDTVIEIEHLFKEYRLGLIGYGTLREDLQSWWAKARGKEDPNSMLFSENQSRDGKAPDHILALNDINLEVKQGERLGIIGNNGAGKTTLLKILSRIASPTKGKARIKGRVASLIAVGTGFHGELTGRENIYLNGSILGLRKFEIDRRFDEIVDFSGVEQFIDTPVKRYSSGMYVRLGFAVAAHLDPDVLIVDEVLAVGDAEFRKKALGKMKDVSKGGGRTVLFVSHNMESIKMLCTRAVLLEQGKLIYDANANETVTRYLQGVSETAEIDIRDRTDRTGDGRLKITAIELFDKDGKHIREAISGEYLKQKFYYELNGEIDHKHFDFSNSFYNDKGDLLTSLPSEEMGIEFNKFTGDGVLIVIIPRLTLRGGEYNIGFSIKEGGRNVGGWVIIDEVKNAIKLNVIPGDYWKCNIINRPGDYLLLDGEITNKSLNKNPGSLPIK
jgi:lipopolysaccharide transport system ATP-binding protein